MPSTCLGQAGYGLSYLPAYTKTAHPGIDFGMCLAYAKTVGPNARPPATNRGTPPMTTTGIPAMTTTQLLDCDRAIGRGLDLPGLTDSQRRVLLAERPAVRRALEGRHVVETN